jgi:hypothetical protein
VKVKIKPSGARSSKWYQLLFRFLFGGTVTALTGWIAKRFGPEIGGLFLALPAILPATATLIQEREKEKKKRAGKNGDERGRSAAALDAAGAAMGSIGLIAFAIVVWLAIQRWPTYAVLLCATLTWFLVAVGVWGVRETLCRRIRAHRSGHLLHAPVNRH